MEIRLMNDSDDRKAISKIYEKSWKFAYQGLIPQDYLDGIPAGNWAKAVDTPGWNTLLMLDGGRIVGTASYCHSRFKDWKDYGEIISIYFLPAYMGKGYGRALLQAALDKLAEMGCTDILLWVLAENERAKKFYEKNGFSASGAYLDDNIGGKSLKELQYVRHVETRRDQ
ncbi:MAG: N-acetyltransferase family protein [Emergencia timonensis]|uniref:GNAT family N-acetyltransferase n=1 Tax=Emergencia timonensis TaxID=1776384 RepID=UPI000832280B|nr:GNAT family N-acetyltransferase [Emergencia timonensis]WNX87379.1 GNAT family N-acetyltransferase [Emergencia timonensis]